MKARTIAAALLATVILVPVGAEAQGVFRGAEEGSARGSRAAGPVGGVVGGAVGAGVGGAAGAVNGVLGIPQKSRVQRARRNRARNR